MGGESHAARPPAQPLTPGSRAIEGLGAVAHLAIGTRGARLFVRHCIVASDGDAWARHDLAVTSDDAAPCSRAAAYSIPSIGSRDMKPTPSRLKKPVFGSL
jgi:hypothetical protein